MGHLCPPLSPTPPPPHTHSLRRGAAFGIAGVVKGLGIMAMKNFGIMDSLKTAVEDKKEASSREVSG